MDVRKGIIQSFYGSYGSGIAYLEIEDSVTGILEQVPCENAQTVRCLEGAFGDVMAPGHTVGPNGGHIGQEIYWSTDDVMGLLEAFTPVDDAGLELVEAYESQEQED